MRRTLAFAALVLGQAGCGSSCSPLPPVPEPDQCDGAAVGQVDALILGQGEGDGFTPLVDDAVVALTYGSQGGAMLRLGFRLGGADVPACVPHHSRLLGCPWGQVCDAPVVLAELTVPLATYPLDGSGRETHELFLILGTEPMAASRIRVESELAGLTAGLDLWLDAVGPDAAPPDAMPIDATPIDATDLADAAPPDAAL